MGFHYTYDETTREFAHATGIVVMTPEGRISHYFYGIQYPAGDLRLALVEASNPSPPSWPLAGRASGTRSLPLP